MGCICRGKATIPWPKRWELSLSQGKVDGDRRFGDSGSMVICMAELGRCVVIDYNTRAPKGARADGLIGSSDPSPNRSQWGSRVGVALAP